MEYRDTSFGQMVTEQERNAFGLYLLTDNPPAHDRERQTIERATIVYKNDGYVQMYRVTDKVLSRDVSLGLFNRQFKEHLVNHFNLIASERQYDNSGTCLVRAGYPGPFQNEAQAFGGWMDGCNVLAYAYLNAITVGEKEIPQDAADFIDSLPKMVWPSA